MEPKSGWFGDVSKNVAVGLTIVAVTAAAAAFSPPLWRWLRAVVDPEVARGLAFLLALTWIFSRDIAPRRSIPVRVSPVLEWGPEAVLTVRNLGHDATFYASADVLDVREPGVSGNFRRLSTQPTWGGGYMVFLSSAQIRRNQTGDLILAWTAPNANTGMLDVGLTDEGKKEIRFRYDKGPLGGIEIDLEVTITRQEKRWFLLALPHPRSYVARFTVTGYKFGGLSVHPLPSGVGGWRRFFHRSPDAAPPVAPS